MSKSRLSIRVAASASAGAIALVLVSAPAFAQQACGIPQDGVVHCTPADGPFPNGIQYESPTDITLNLDDGLTIAPDVGTPGVLVDTDTGSIAINGPGVTINTRDATGAVASALNGDVTIDLATVSTEVVTEGELARGIDTWASGTTTINAGSVSTKGAYSQGIISQSTTGDINISAGSVSTDGFASDGIVATTGGNVNIRAGTIEGQGDYVFGVNVYNGQQSEDVLHTGYTSIDVDKIDIKGDNAMGVMLTTYSDAYVRVGDLSITGDAGNGIIAQGLGAINVEVGNATIKGNGSGIGIYGDAGASVKVGSLTTENGGGVSVTSYSNAARADVGTVHVSGDFAPGVQAASYTGDARVRANEVTTTGNFGTAIDAQALLGAVSVEAGKVSTIGDVSYGLRAYGKTTTVILKDSLTTAGSYATGILSSTTRGNALISVVGSVATTGDGSEAMWITGRYGMADIRASGAVSTAGDMAHAIRAVGEDGQVSVAANSVKTTGANSDGINARTRYVEFFFGQQPGLPPVPFTGDIDIRAADVSVIGAGSMGISARGLGKATILAGNVSAADNYAVETNMIGTSTLDLRGAIRSKAGSAVFAEGSDVAVAIGSGASVSGGQDGLIVKAVGKRCVMPNPDDGVSTNPCPNPGDEWSNPNPTSVAVTAADVSAAVELAGKAHVVNDGIITGGSGYAVRVDAGTLTLDNRGTISGGVKFAGGDDLFNNAGRFEIGRDSDFGAGADTLVNTGTVALRRASAPATMQLAGLEQFRNAGLVDLRNGAIGDALTLSGDYVGSGTATLALDADFSGGKADRLVVSGAATGSTRILLALDPTTARLTSGKGIVLVQTGAGSSDTAFSLSDTSRDIGFLRYALNYDTTTRSYALTGTAGAAAYRQLGIVQAAEAATQAPVDIWRSQMTADRDIAFADAGAKPRGKLWGTLQGGTIKRDWSARSGGERFGLDYRQNRYGSQLGYDLVGRESDHGAFRFGVTGGYGESKLDYDGTSDRFDLTTWDVGLYASYTGDRLFANLIGKYDSHEVKVRSVALGDRPKLDGSTWGANAEVGARFGNAGMFVEPVAGLAWTSTDIDTLRSGAVVVDYRRASDVAGRLGARFGGATRFSGGGAIRLHVGGNLVHHFGDPYRLRLTSGASQSIEASRLKTYGEGEAGISYRTAAGFEGFVEGQGELASGYHALTGRVGFRLPL